MMMIMAILNEN